MCFLISLDQKCVVDTRTRFPAISIPTWPCCSHSHCLDLVILAPCEPDQVVFQGKLKNEVSDELTDNATDLLTHPTLGQPFKELPPLRAEILQFQFVQPTFQLCHLTKSMCAAGLCVQTCQLVWLTCQNSQSKHESSPVSAVERFEGVCSQTISVTSVTRVD